jgi:spore coat polysaccharide biosynthesis protein SpsF (cytidylyltransferase family)
MNENQKKFKINRILPPKIFQRPEVRITVDSPQDLWVARIIHEQLGKGIKPISLKKIIKFLDNNPEITQINSKTLIGKSRIWT